MKKSKDFEFVKKLRLCYTLTMYVFLENPLLSVKELRKTIRLFCVISGYKINEEDIHFVGTSKQLKQSILDIMPAKWCADSIRYLGIKICRSHEQR